MKKVYKKDTLICDMSTGVCRNTEDMYVICGGYFCRLSDRRLVSSSRIHFISPSEAVDLDGNKYTFSDTCFVISRLLGNQRTVYSDFHIGVPNDLWTRTQGININKKNISLGTYAYCLVPGSKIHGDDGATYIVTENKLHDDHVVIAAKNNVHDDIIVIM